MSQTTQQLPDANDFLFSGGVPSAKFDTHGVTVAGTITAPPSTQQQTDFDSGEPKFWDDGRPMLQVVVDLRTDLRDPEIEDDNGTRRLYVRGKHLTAAVRDAVRKAGGKKLEVGAELAVTYVGDDAPKRRGASGAKQYRAEYRPAAETALGGGEPSAQPAAGAVPEQTPAPAAGAAAGGQLDHADFPHLSPEQFAGVQAAGLSADQVRQMFPAPANA